MEIEIKLSKKVKTRSGEGETSVLKLNSDNLTANIIFRAGQIAKENRLADNEMDKSLIMAGELADLSFKTLQSLSWNDAIKLAEAFGQLAGESVSPPISENA
jgi:hypothetical protein